MKKHQSNLTIKDVLNGKPSIRLRQVLTAYAEGSYNTMLKDVNTKELRRFRNCGKVTYKEFLSYLNTPSTKDLINAILLSKDSDVIWAIQNELSWTDFRYVLEVFNEERLESIKDNLDSLRASRKLGKN